jgi:3-oxoacyl-[acyl-carrier protein] reductase
MFTALDGRTVIVTGGSKGIGKGIARVFARAGANLLVAARDEGTLQTAADDIGKESGGRVETVVADVSKVADCQLIADTAVERFGGIDVLCANAGIFPQKLLAEMTEADVDEVFACNVKGTMFSVQACLPALEASGRGRVILTSSITGPITGFTGWSHYGASKSAQLGFMRTAAIELSPRRVTINAVLPGNVITEGMAAMSEEYIRESEAIIPLHRLGSVEDIGYAALFFATDEASYITGQTIVVDGGQVLPESPEALVGI